MARHVCCLVLQSSISLLYFEGGCLVLREQYHDDTEIVSHILRFKAQDVRILIARFDEELYYEKTPLLYPWELTAYRQRQMRKKFSSGAFADYQTVSVLRTAPWKIKAYHVCYYGFNQDDAIQNLLAIISQSGVPVVSVFSSGLSAFHSVQSLFPHLEVIKKSLLSILVIRTGEHDFRQVFVSHGVTMVSRLITIDSTSPNQQYVRLQQEVAVLIKYLKTQNLIEHDALPALFFVAGQDDDSQAIDRCFVHVLGCFYRAEHCLRMPELPYADAFLMHQASVLRVRDDSDYHPSMVRRVQALLAWRKPLVALSGLVMVVFVLMVVGVQQQLSMVTGLSQKTQTALSALPSPVSNQTVLSTNVQLLQERLALIHSVVSMSEQVRLVEMMHAVAAVMVQFPEIQLTDVTFEAGTDQVNQGFMHDHQHQRIHLMGSVDATRVGSLQAEVALLKRLLDALSHIAQVREVAQVDGQLMTLDQKAFSVSLSQDHVQSVRHSMHLVLQVRSE